MVRSCVCLKRAHISYSSTHDASGDWLALYPPSHDTSEDWLALLSTLSEHASTLEILHLDGPSDEPARLPTAWLTSFLSLQHLRLGYETISHEFCSNKVVAESFPGVSLVPHLPPNLVTLSFHNQSYLGRTSDAVALKILSGTTDLRRLPTLKAINFESLKSGDEPSNDLKPPSPASSSIVALTAIRKRWRKNNVEVRFDVVGQNSRQ